MPVIIQLTGEDGRQKYVNANKILCFYRMESDELTWLDVEEGGFLVKETPGEIDQKIDAAIEYVRK